MKKTWIILLIVFNVVFASTAASFLENGGSARSEAVGRAFTAVADDLDAYYYNPAGYAQQRAQKVNTLFTKINNEQDVYYGGYGRKVFGGYGALNFYMSSLGDIPETTYDGTYVVETGDSFEYSSYAMFFSYGCKLNKVIKGLPDNLDIGFTLKQIKEKLHDYQASGTGLDLGLLYNYERFTIGYSIINLLEPRMSWDTDSGYENVVERKHNLGVAYRLNKSWLLSFDITVKKNENLSGLGVEYQVNDKFFLRAGSFTDNTSFGLGFLYQNFNFDYVYVQPVEDLVENTHRLSIGYIFASTKVEQQKEAVAPIASVEEKQPTASLVPELKVIEAEPARLTLQKKNIIVAPDKLKCFYKLVNNNDQLLNGRLLVELIDAAGNVIDQNEVEFSFEPQSEELLNVLLGEGQQLLAGSVYQVRAKIILDNGREQIFQDSINK